MNMLAFRARYYVGVLTYLFNVAVYYFIWRAVYHGGATVGGLTLDDMITYVAVGWAIRSFYFDTALSGGTPPLAALAQVADPDRILFGTDFPFAPTFAIRNFGSVLDEIDMPGVEMTKVYGQNASRLLAR